MDEEVEEFLEHFGVPGMKWGVRKVRTKRANNAKYVADRARRLADAHPSTVHNLGAKRTQAKADRLQRRVDGKRTPQDIARSVAKGAIVAGVIVAALSVRVDASKFGGPPRMPHSPPSNAVADVIRRTRDEQMSSLTRTFKEGHMNEEQYKRFAKTMEERYARKIAEAMKNAGG